MKLPRSTLYTRAQPSRSTSRSGVLHSKLISDAFEEFLAEKRHGWKSTNGSEGRH